MIAFVSNLFPLFALYLIVKVIEGDAENGRSAATSFLFGAAAAAAAGAKR
jgi:hypothetical protein